MAGPHLRLPSRPGPGPGTPPGYRVLRMPTHGAPVGPFPPGVDPDTYDRLRRRVLWRLPMGLYVLGSASADRSRLNLMTINWAMQVSTDPKHLAVSVERSAVTHELVSDGGCFALALVARSDRAEVRKFVKPAAHDPAARTLAGMPYRTAATGAPIPEIAVAFLDCEVRHELDVGSHTLFVGEVVLAGTATAWDDAGQDGAGGNDAGGNDGDDEIGEVLRMEDTRMSYGG